MDLLKEHVNAVGVEHALAALGENKTKNAASQVQYEGAYDELSESGSEAAFIKNYLARSGISLLQTGTAVDPNVPII